MLLVPSFADTYRRRTFIQYKQPGGILTNLQGSVGLRRRINYNVVAPFVFKAITQGAATTIFCAMAPLNDAKLQSVLVPGEYHDNCAVQRQALRSIMEYCTAPNKPDIVNDCWSQTERLLKDLGF